jgi:hypothetical protein
VAAQSERFAISGAGDAARTPAQRPEIFALQRSLVDAAGGIPTFMMFDGSQ